MATEYIKRQAALNIVCPDDCPDCPDGGCDLYRRMKKVPAADVICTPKWVSVKERLPETDGEYIIWTDMEAMFPTNYDSCTDEPDERWGNWHEYFDMETLGCLGSEWEPVKGVTHWLDFQIPKPPEEKADED